VSRVALNIEVDIKPTEDPEKVKIAVKNLFEPSSIELVPQQKGSLIKVKTVGKEGLTKFYMLLRRERILTAARKVLIKGISDRSITFCLNKQAAYMMRISFCEPIGESPLGPIRVEIEGDDPKALIDWLAPRI
jgi:predicted RNA binding protein with dsRBD fold (UPF0201 family)